jgi:hypothetical protein
MKNALCLFCLILLFTATFEAANAEKLTSKEVAEILKKPRGILNPELYKDENKNIWKLVKKQAYKEPKYKREKLKEPYLRANLERSISNLLKRIEMENEIELSQAQNELNFMLGDLQNNDRYSYWQNRDLFIDLIPIILNKCIDVYQSSPQDYSSNLRVFFPYFEGGAPQQLQSIKEIYAKNKTNSGQVCVTAALAVAGKSGESLIREIVKERVGDVILSTLTSFEQIVNGGWVLEDESLEMIQKIESGVIANKWHKKSLVKKHIKRIKDRNVRNSASDRTMATIPKNFVPQIVTNKENRGRDLIDIGVRPSNQNIYDITLIAYDEEFANEFSYAEDHVQKMDSGLRYLEIQMKTEGRKTNCYYNFILDSNLQVDFPEENKYRISGLATAKLKKMPNSRDKDHPIRQGRKNKKALFKHLKDERWWKTYGRRHQRVAQRVALGSMSPEHNKVMSRNISLLTYLQDRELPYRIFQTRSSCKEYKDFLQGSPSIYVQKQNAGRTVLSTNPEDYHAFSIPKSLVKSFTPFLKMHHPFSHAAN